MNASIVAELLDKAKKRRSIPTDMALGERLGRSRAIVSQWRKGDKHPEDDTICALATLAGVAPTPYLVAVQAERSHGEAAKVWTALARQLGAAAVIVLCAMPMIGNAAPSMTYKNDFRAMPIM